MALQDHLMSDEYVLARCIPFYVTTHRVMRYEQNGEREQVGELPYARIRAVELTKRPRYGIMIGGILLTALAVFLFFLGFVSSFFALALGAGLVVYGSQGQEAYYQLRIHNMPEEEQSRWRINFRGSAKFIIALGEQRGRYFPG